MMVMMMMTMVMVMVMMTMHGDDGDDNGDGDHDSAKFAAETLKQHRDRSIQILIKRSLLLEKTILKKLARFSLSFKPV